METIETTAATVAQTIPKTTETTIETTAETVPETTAETVPEAPADTKPVYDSVEDLTEATEPIEIFEETEVVETYDYVATLVQIEENTALTAEASGLIAGFSLFNVVVILCFFVYKFFRIFF